MLSRLMPAPEIPVEEIWECTTSVIEAFVFLAGSLCAPVHNQEDFFVMKPDLCRN
jgi:hypothetical protein